MKDWLLTDSTMPRWMVISWWLVLVANAVPSSWNIAAGVIAVAGVALMFWGLIAQLVRGVARIRRLRRAGGEEPNPREKSGGIVFVPRVHRCLGLLKSVGDVAPTWWHPAIGSALFGLVEDGTVVRCDECGATWVSQQFHTGLMSSYWRRESRFEHWRRERRSKRAGEWPSERASDARIRALLDREIPIRLDALLAVMALLLDNALYSFGVLPLVRGAAVLVAVAMLLRRFLHRAPSGQEKVRADGDR